MVIVSFILSLGNEIMLAVLSCFLIVISFLKIIIHIDLIDGSNVIFTFILLYGCYLSLLLFLFYFLIYLSISSPSQSSLKL